MRKKTANLIIILLLVLFISGCTANINIDKSTNVINNSQYKTSGLKYISCTRDLDTGDSSTTVDVNYKIYYNDDQNLEIFKSTEKVTSTSPNVLDQYEKAYKDSYAQQNELDYYDSVVTREKTTVTNKVNINYGKIDINKLMDIEGTEDNVTVTNGKIKLSDWKTFAKKYGVTCEDGE